MGKKKDKFAKAEKSPSAVPLKLEGVSKRGWKVIGLGIGVVTMGFYILSLTDPAGQNWASNLCPFVILGGYATIGIGIVLPDRSENGGKIRQKEREPGEGEK